MELGNMIFGHSRGSFPIEREFWENNVMVMWGALLNAIPCDHYGHYEGKVEGYRTKLGGFTCDLFEVNPYYWGECDCDAEENDWDYDYHKPNCSLCIPNFIYRSVDEGEALEIRWYKHPFRDSYANREIAPDEFACILKECYNYIKSMKEGV